MVLEAATQKKILAAMAELLADAADTNAALARVTFPDTAGEPICALIFVGGRAETDAVLDAINVVERSWEGKARKGV